MSKEHPKAKRVQVEVDVPLTEAMVEHRGMRIAQLLVTKEEMEDKAKSAAKAAKKQIDEVQEQIDKLGAEIRTASAKAMVDAEEQMHFETNMVRTVRVDPEGCGVIVSERAMTDEERQQELAIDLDDDGEKPAPVKAKRGGRKPKEDGATTH